MIHPSEKLGQSERSHPQSILRNNRCKPTIFGGNSVIHDQKDYGGFGVPPHPVRLSKSEVPARGRSEGRSQIGRCDDFEKLELRDSARFRHQNVCVAPPEQPGKL